MIDNTILTGFIVIPEGVERDKFVSSCYTKQTFSVQTSDGGYIPDVFCLKHVVNEIEMPKNEKELGSQVILGNLSRYSSYVILGTLNKIPEGQANEDSLNQIKERDGVSLGLFGDIASRILKVLCKGITDLKSTLLIECIGNKESELILNSSGWVRVYAEEEEGGIVLKNKDREIRLDKDAVTISFDKDKNIQLTEDEFVYQDDTTKFEIKEGKFIFGQVDLEDYFKKILDFLKTKIQLTTPTGPTGKGATLSMTELTKLEQEIQKMEKKK